MSELPLFGQPLPIRRVSTATLERLHEGYTASPPETADDMREFGAVHDELVLRAHLGQPSSRRPKRGRPRKEGGGR